MSEKKIILIFGKRGSGKSYLSQKLIQEQERILVFDTMGEYNEGVVFNAEDDEAFRQFWRKVYQHPYHLVYRPLKPAEEIEPLADLVYTIGDICFVVEELDCYCSPFQISDSFAQIIQRGRHKNITLIGISQRPYGIHRLLTAQAKEIYIFNTNEPRDREYFRTLLGQEIEAKIDQLKEYEYVFWQDSVDGFEIGKA